MNYPPKNWLRSVVSRNSFNPDESREFIEAFTKEATSGDYNHLLATVMEVVEVE